MMGDSNHGGQHKAHHIFPGCNYTNTQIITSTTTNNNNLVFPGRNCKPTNDKFNDNNLVIVPSTSVMTSFCPLVMRKTSK